MKKITSLILALALIASFAAVIPSFAAEAYTDMSTWDITASSDGIGNIIGAFDNNPASYWHTSYTVTDGQISDKAELPHVITIVFPSSREVSGIRYLPRQINGGNNSSAGIWSKAEIYTSTDGKNFTLSANATFNLVASRASADVPIKKGEYKAIMIKVTEAAGGFGTAAEISILKGDVTASSGSSSEAAKETTTVSTGVAANTEASVYNDMSTWNVTATSGGIGDISGAFDNNIDSYWHTNYVVEDGKIVSHDMTPHIITIIFPQAREVDGIRYVPRTLKSSDSTAGIWKEAEIYTSKDAENFTLAATVKYNQSVMLKRETADAAIKRGEYKAIMIKVTESVGGYGTAAEIKVLYGNVANTNNVTSSFEGYKTETIKKEDNVDNAGKLNTTFVDGKKNWNIKVSSCAPFTNAESMLDSNTKTFWHSNYTASGSTVTSSDKPPFTIDVTMPQAVTAAGFSSTTRPDNESGVWLEYKLLASATDTGELTEIYHGFLDEGRGQKTQFFSANIVIKRMQIIVLKTTGVGTCSEIDLVSPFADYITMKPEEYTAFSAQYEMKTIPLDHATISANCESWVDNYPQLAIDGKMGRFWQSATDAKPPFILDLDLSNVYSIARIDIVPRGTTDWHGTWETFNIWISTDGKNFTKIKDDLHFAKSVTPKVIKLENPVEARCIRFEITQGYTDKAACSEIFLYETAEDYAKRLAEKSEKYVLQIDSKEIKVTKGQNTTSVSTDVAPYIYGGSTLIPLRGLLEQMGAKVTWSDEDQKVTIEKGAYTISFQIWDNLVYVAGTKYGTVRYTLPQYPRITDSRTFIPLRFVSEHLGYNVEWNGETREITITNITE